LESQDNNGHTPWSAHIRLDNVLALRHLAKVCANVETKGRNGDNVLYGAAASGDTEKVKLLLSFGINPSIMTDFHWAPIHWASHNGRFETVKVLLKAGAHVNAASDQEKKALGLALESSQTAIVQLLRQHGGQQSKDLTTKDNLTLAERIAMTHLKPVESHNSFFLTFGEPFRRSTTLGQFVYACRHSHGNAFLPFQLSHPLDRRDPLHTRRSSSRPTMMEYPPDAAIFLPERAIYSITPRTADFQDLEVRPLGQHELGRVVCMRRGWNGSWKAYEEVDGDNVPLFLTRPD